MRLNEQYRMELAKRLGLGWAAASDILRLAILERFGGIYTDPDNPSQGMALEGMEGLRELFDDRGFAVHARMESSHGIDAIQFNNSALLAARGHPVVRRYLDHIEHNYTLSQEELLGADPSERHTRSSQEAWLRPGGRLRRYSLLARTGPTNLDQIESGAARVSLRDAVADPIRDGHAASWLPPTRHRNRCGITQKSRRRR
jgi:hypothetical protein